MTPAIGPPSDLILQGLTFSVLASCRNIFIALLFLTRFQSIDLTAHNSAQTLFALTQLCTLRPDQIITQVIHHGFEEVLDGNSTVRHDVFKGY